jgi:ATP-binding cassette subfamily C protein LapB
MNIGQFARAPGIKLEVFLVSLIINVLALALPLSLLQVYDRILPNQGYATTTVLVMAVLGALAMEALLRLARSYLMGILGMRFERQAASAAVEHLLRTDLDDFERDNSGLHIERVGAVSQLRDYYSGQSILTLYDLPFAAIYLWLVHVLGGPLVWVPTALLGGYMIVGLLWGNRLQQHVQRLTHLENERMGFLIGAVSGIHTVKSLAMEEGVARRYEKLQESRSAQSLKVELMSTVLLDMGAAIGQWCTVLVVSWGAILVLGDHISTGALSACLLLAGRALQPLQNAVNFWTRFQTISTARRQLRELFEMRRDYIDVSQQAPADLTGAVRLDRVSFRFPGADRYLLRNISLTVKPGEIIAISGINGSGKSVLMSIIAGLQQPTDGRVLLDGLEPYRHDPTVLDDQVAYMAQREQLFRGTILENLSMFRPERRDRSAMLARMTGLSDIVSNLPQGYRTLVGDGAQEFLPRGVIQQIAIVRALAGNPRLILFDEANTAMDDLADRAFKKLLTDTMKGKVSAILVTHRPSFMRIADRTYRLEDGKLTEFKMEPLPPRPAGPPPAAGGGPVQGGPVPGGSGGAAGPSPSGPAAAAGAPAPARPVAGAPLPAARPAAPASPASASESVRLPQLSASPAAAPAAASAPPRVMPPPAVQQAGPAAPQSEASPSVTPISPANIPAPPLPAAPPPAAPPPVMRRAVVTPAQPAPAAQTPSAPPKQPPESPVAAAAAAPVPAAPPPVVRRAVVTPAQPSPASPGEASSKAAPAPAAPPQVIRRAVVTPAQPASSQAVPSQAPPQTPSEKTAAAPVVRRRAIVTPIQPLKPAAPSAEPPAAEPPKVNLNRPDGAEQSPPAASETKE